MSTLKEVKKNGISFKIDGFKEMKKFLLEYGNEIQAQFLDDTADAVLSHAQKLLREGEIQNSKAEIKNAYYKGDLTRSGFVAEDGQSKRRVVFDTPYAVATEYGRPKGIHPPVQPLIEWAEYRKIPNPESVGWAIAKTIEKEGMLPRPFLAPSVVQARAKLIDIFKNAVQIVMSKVSP